MILESHLADILLCSGVMHGIPFIGICDANLWPHDFHTNRSILLFAEVSIDDVHIWSNWFILTLELDVGATERLPDWRACPGVLALVATGLEPVFEFDIPAVAAPCVWLPAVEEELDGNCCGVALVVCASLRFSNFKALAILLKACPACGVLLCPLI